MRQMDGWMDGVNLPSRSSLRTINISVECSDSVCLVAINICISAARHRLATKALQKKKKKKKGDAPSIERRKEQQCAIIKRLTEHWRAAIKGRKEGGKGRDWSKLKFTNKRTDSPVVSIADVLCRMAVTLPYTANCLTGCLIRMFRRAEAAEEENRKRSGPTAAAAALTTASSSDQLVMRRR